MAKAKKAAPGIKLMLDRERTLVLNLGSLRLLEERLGKTLFEVIDWNNLGVRDISLLLWAGLLKDDPEITQEESDELFSYSAIRDNLEQLQGLVQALMAESFPEPKVTDDDEEKKTKSA